MISDPLKNITPGVASVLTELLPDSVNSGYNGDVSYNNTHKRRYARTIDVLLKSESLSGKKILEIATSDILPVAIRELVPDTDISVTHFDLSGKTSGKYKVDFAGRKFTVPGYFVDLETMPLPVEDETFDVVLCCEVLEHMDVDPMFMLEQINRVLKPGGLLVLTTPNITSSRALWKMLRGIEPYFYMQYHKDGSPYRHNYEYSHGGLTSLLSAAGFNGDIWTEDSFEDGIISDAMLLETAGFKINYDLLGDNLFASVRKVSGVVDRYPSPIYV